MRALERERERKKARNRERELVGTKEGGKEDNESIGNATALLQRK